MKLFITVSAFLLTGGVMIIPSVNNSQAIAANTFCKNCSHFHPANTACSNHATKTY